MKPFFGSDPDVFLKQVWQTRPAFFKGGLGNPALPFDRSGFIKLSSDKRLVSRLVLADTHFIVDYGPFSPRRFRSLPETNWTLLISETDRIYREIHQLKSHLPFIPGWRMDDIMISYGVPGGTVGPHIDEYDVFLIQIGGEKRWRITDSRITSPVYRRNEELRILEQFKPDREFICKTGDVLYLPPGIGHEGTTLEPGFTVSIGFRAPSLKEGLPVLADLLLASGSDWRFGDKGRQPDRDPHLLSETDQARMKNLMAEFSGSDVFRHWAGRMVTESKRGFVYKKPRLKSTDLLKVKNLTWAPGVRRVLIEGQPLLLYIEGTHFPLPGHPLLKQLIGEDSHSEAIVDAVKRDKDLTTLVKTCIRNGWLIPSSS
ncbi:MAG: hypothetical protein HUU10_00215 [Bacteroidetes bacterium]|nr:hypothetical protein [Bacteroidota bacterium]